MLAIVAPASLLAVLLLCRAAVWLVDTNEGCAHLHEPATCHIKKAVGQP